MRVIRTRVVQLEAAMNNKPSWRPTLFILRWRSNTYRMQLLSTTKRLIQRHLKWNTSIEPVVLVVLAIATASAWGFILVATNMLEGDTYAFDRWLLGAMRDAANPAEPVGPRWLEVIARDATALGGFAWLAAATAAIAMYLWLDGKSHMAIFLVAATASGGIMSALLKSLFDRPRPDLVPHLTHVSSSSFPSGHSMLAAVVYVTLGSLLAAVTSRLALKIYVLAVAMLLAIVVGISRIYLGVHYPTDVLAGWLAGLIWALVCWLIARWLQRRGQVEKDSNQPG
jgi:undecaprenyl-diphosphatase